MKIHTVNSPFMSREGQFEEGKQTLCIGLDVHSLLGTDTYRCYLGKNIKVYYEIDTTQALAVADYHKSFWKNPKGKTVAIIPLSEFERKEATNGE